MNIMSTLIVVATVVVAGVGPFVAVHIGGKAFDDEPEHDELDDNTTQIPRVTDEADPYSY